MEFMRTGKSVPVFSKRRALPPSGDLLIRSVISEISRIGSTKVLMRTSSPAFSSVSMKCFRFLYAIRSSKIYAKITKKNANAYGISIFFDSDDAVGDPNIKASIKT